MDLPLYTFSATLPEPDWYGVAVKVNMDDQMSQTHRDGIVNAIKAYIDSIPEATYRNYSKQYASSVAI